MIIEDYGILLSSVPFGERGSIITVFLKNHGLTRGLYRFNKKEQNEAQRGAILDLVWKARLENQLGTFQVISCRVSILTDLIYSKIKSLILNSSIDLCSMVLQEGERHYKLFDSLENLIHILHRNDNSSPPDLFLLQSYCCFELDLLAELGYGLNLTECAVSGKKSSELFYISPRSGMSVLAEYGEPYKDRLFTIPPFFLDRSIVGDRDEIIEGMRITSYFMEKRLKDYYRFSFPASRSLLLAELS